MSTYFSIITNPTQVEALNKLREVESDKLFEEHIESRSMEIEDLQDQLLSSQQEVKLANCIQF